MPGIAARFVVSDFVRDRLSASSSSHAPLFTDPATAPLVALGALGPALADLIAAEPDVGGNAPNSFYYRAWFPILQLLADNNTTTPPTAGVLSNLRTIRETLDQLRPILAGRDKLALIGMAGQLSGLSKVVQQPTNADVELDAESRCDRHEYLPCGTKGEGRAVQFVATS